MDTSKLCILILPTTTSLATVDFSNVEQLAITALTSVTQMSAHTITLLDNVISKLHHSKGEQWMIVTNIQLLADPELALGKLLEVQ